MENFLYLLLAGICFQKAIKLATRPFEKDVMTSGIEKPVSFSKLLLSQYLRSKQFLLVDVFVWLLLGSFVILCLSQLKN
jgi:hypothetical protein